MTRYQTTLRRGKTMLIVLISVMLLLAMAVFWLRGGGSAQPDIEAGRVASDKFLESIRQGQAAQAWESTTAEFKSAEGRESFVRSVKKHPALGKPLSFVSVQTVTIQKNPRAEYVYRSAAGGETIRLLTGYDGGAWRIDRIAMD